jgi:hypothetical protein
MSETESTTVEPTPLKKALLDEGVWRSWAVSLAIAGPLGLIAAIAFVIFAPEQPNYDVAMKTRVDILAPLGVIYIATITFCTVVWRGLISTRQTNAQLAALDLQRQQIDKLSLQIATTEDNNLAQLLQKGAELISDGAEAKVQAGIATLHALADAKSDKFAAPALDLIADYIAQIGSGTNQISTVRSAIDALNAVKNSRNRISGRMFSFIYKKSVTAPHPMGEWVSFPAAKTATYAGGKFRIEFIHPTADIIHNNSYFGVAFERCNFLNASANQMEECTFDECKFYNEVDVVSGNNIFKRCNFSWAIVDIDKLPNLRSGNNWYSRSRPPRAKGSPTRNVDWTRYFEERADES